MLTTDKLLRDRYKVIGPYPCSPYNIGDIITMPEEGRSFHLTTTMHTDEFGERVKQQNWHAPAEILNYPNLFQPLPWWSDREISEFPEYVKVTSIGCTVERDSIVKVEGAAIFDDNTFDNVGEPYVLIRDKYFDTYGLTRMNCKNCVPATLEQYNQQKEGMK